MTAKTATITTRVAPYIKEEADAMFSRLGMNTSEAISIFLHQALNFGGLPFSVAERIPTPAFQAALDEVDAIFRGELPMPPSMSVDEFFAEMEAELKAEMEAEKNAGLETEAVNEV